MSAKYDLLFAGLGAPDMTEALEFGELGLGAAAGVYLADVAGSFAENSLLASSMTFAPSGRNGQLLIAAGQVVLGGGLGYAISKKSKPLGYGFGAGMISAGLNRALLTFLNGTPLPGVKPWAFVPTSAASAAALPTSTLPVSGFGYLGAAPTLVQQLNGLGAAPTLVQELNGVGDVDDLLLPFLG